MRKMGEMGKCKKCRFWQRYPAGSAQRTRGESHNELGVCSYNPPVPLVLASGQIHSRWPVTSEADGCSKHEEGTPQNARFSNEKEKS